MKEREGPDKHVRKKESQEFLARNVIFFNTTWKQQKKIPYKIRKTILNHISF